MTLVVGSALVVFPATHGGAEFIAHHIHIMGREHLSNDEVCAIAKACL